MENRFTRSLIRWHEEQNTREMPWKGEKDPYKIWLSEVILQQTRVAQGLSYYNNFIRKYPDIRKLAKAPDQEVFKLWEGLGYYNRCRNLLFTAREIAEKRQGVFPDTYEEILALKGVGPYTAAAIASFAYNLPHAVVDGNVFRVLSRFFGISEAIDSTKGKQVFTTMAEQVLDKKHPGLFNQAIMDFGAVVCTPFTPHCSSCPLQKHCAAFATGMVNQLPVKQKTLLRRHRWFYYFLFTCNGKIMVNERSAKDIWQNLYEFYLVESGDAMHWTDILVREWLSDQFGVKEAIIKSISPPMVQQLTHQQIKGQFIRIELKTIPSFLTGYQWQSLSRLRKLPFPKFITHYLETPSIQKSLF